MKSVDEMDWDATLEDLKGQLKDAEKALKTAREGLIRNGYSGAKLDDYLSEHEGRIRAISRKIVEHMDTKGAMKEAARSQLAIFGIGMDLSPVAFNALRKSVMQYVKNTLAGNYAINPDLGKVYFTKRGLKHLVSQTQGPNASMMLQAVHKLREGVEKGTYLGKSLPRENEHPEAKYFHYIQWAPYPNLLLQIDVIELKKDNGASPFVYAQHQVIEKGRQLQ